MQRKLYLHNYQLEYNINSMFRNHITEESFCGFFISQKTLVNLMEVICRVNDTVELYVKELKVCIITTIITEWC